MKFKLILSLLLLNFSLIATQANADDYSDLIPDIRPEMTGLPMSSVDRYESFNRPIFEFNMEFNQYIGKPLADAYSDVLPSPVRIGLDNFFNNLAVPLSSLNSFLQGNVEDGLSSFMRFTINSTFGFLGLLDIATPAGIENKNEDFGQTLYTWGLWQETNYIVLPFLGPYTTRNLVGSQVDSYVNPIYPHFIQADSQQRVLLYLSSSFVSYVKVMKLIDNLQNQPDPYVFARESYLQYRTNLIFNGKAPLANLDDFDFE